MSKGQTKTSRENRKPKKAGPAKHNASNPTQKSVSVPKPAENLRPVERS